ncbi:uncharacterized protein [Coffea arabica]|uniref:Uncharacterized protein n=1 Tax=Coffea arabica TaxID=13443 RepID=A0ABM4X924_COFAR
MVWRLMSNVWFSVIINGAAYGFFKSSRGIRQGDPLSQALFVIGVEVLSRGLNSLSLQQGFVGFTVPRGCTPVTYLAFADDVLIFANGSSRSLKDVMLVLPPAIVATVVQIPTPHDRGRIKWYRCRRNQESLPWHRLFRRSGKGRLPLDDVVRGLGVQVASKCFCCTAAAGETLEHVFSTGQITTAAWAYFQNICGIVHSGSGTRSHLLAWWLSSPASGRLRFLYDIVPSFICWNIWKARCKAVFDGIKVRAAEVCEATFKDVKAVIEIHLNLVGHVHSLPLLCERVLHSPARYEYKIVRWEGNPGASGGGGILRDSSGRLLLAFSAFLGGMSSLRAEALAILTGVQLCLRKGFFPRTIQSDLLLLVGILQRRVQCPWHIRREVEQVWQLVGVSRFVHCYREANKVADILSNMGVSHPHELVRCYSTAQDLPTLARGEAQLNRLGVPSVRRIRVRAT